VTFPSDKPPGRERHGSRRWLNGRTATYRLPSPTPTGPTTLDGVSAQRSSSSLGGTWLQANKQVVVVGSCHRTDLVACCSCLPACLPATCTHTPAHTHTHTHHTHTITHTTHTHTHTVPHSATTLTGFYTHTLTHTHPHIHTHTAAHTTHTYIAHTHLTTHLHTTHTGSAATAPARAPWNMQH